MDIEKMKEGLQKVLATENLHLYDLQTRQEDDARVLEVILDESLDLDALTNISTKISVAMDQLDKDQNTYLLDVTCVGVERPLRSLEEVKAHVGDYIYLRSKQGDEIQGDLLEVDGQELRLKIKNKNIAKKISVSYEDIENVRLAVRF